MEYVGLFFEILFLLLGGFVYRLSSGEMRVSEAQRPAMERFVKENGKIMRLLSTILIVIMMFEIGLQIPSKLIEFSFYNILFNIFVS